MQERINELEQSWQELNTRVNVLYKLFDELEERINRHLKN